MTHEIHKVTFCEIVGPFRLKLGFADGASRTIDFFPVLKGKLFGALRNVDLFNAVSIDPEVHTIVWPNGADFDPATLHDWDRYEQELIATAQSWETPAHR